VIFLPILAKIWLPWQRPLDPCNKKCLPWSGQPQKLPVASNHILAISRTNAFICTYSNFSPKIGCHGNAPLSFVYGSVTEEFPDSTALSLTKLCMDISHKIEVMAIFVMFLDTLAKIRLPWQRPLDHCNQRCLISPVISNRILVTSHANAFICIYSNFSPKIGCHGNAPLSLVYRSVTDEFPDSTNPVLNQTLHGYVAYN